MLFTKESIILLELLHREKLHQKFTFSTQNIIKSQANFSRLMDNLQQKDLVRKHYDYNSNRTAYYDLTYSGRFLAIWFCQDDDTPEIYHNMDKSGLIRMIE